MNTILGGQFSSRINHILREVKGFTYGANSSFHYYRESGLFEVSTAVNIQNTGEAVRDILYELKNIRENISLEEIDFAKSRNGIVDLEDLETLITPKTKLISISLVQFLSGYRADISAIGELCKQHGIIFCVDAIQGTGVVQIDVKKSNIDFLTGGSQKWLMSSQGLSYVYITEELQSRINQKFVGWTSVKDAWNLLDFELTFRDSADRFQNGTVNALGVAIFEASLTMFNQFGIENIERRHC